LQASEPPKRRRLGLLAVCAAAGLWAGAANVASALFQRGVSPAELAEARAAVAFAGFTLFPMARRARPSAARGLQIIGLGVAIAGVNLAYYVAIDHLAVAIAIVMQYTAPALVVLWVATKSRRAPSRAVAVSLVAAVAGVALVTELPWAGASGIDAVGLVAGALSAVLFATYTLLAESLAEEYGPPGAMLRGFAVATLVWAVYQAPRGLPWDLLQPSNLPGVLYIGVAGTLIPFWLFVWGVGQVAPERASIGATLEPVLAGVIAWAWFHQTLSVMQVAGGLLVVAAVIVLSLQRDRVAAPEP
jgi:drug/metabolite transporter (DMT)-like permease